MSQYLGDISAYALAVSQGYTGTEEEYAELMASYATVGQTAVTAAQTATTKASEAATSATTATNKASEATTAATTATTKAGEASTSASTATSAKDTAVSASQTATSKATEATTAAATATSAASTATTAKDDAVSAKTAAQTAQTGAETAAASVQSSAAQIATNTEDIAQLKSEFTALTSDGVVPSAEQILSDKGVTDSVPYHYRKTGGDGADREYVDAIVGGTVNWNQLANTPTITKTFTETATYYNFLGAVLGKAVNPAHKYFLSAYVKRAIASNNSLSVYVGPAGDAGLLIGALADGSPDGFIQNIAYNPNFNTGSSKPNDLSINNRLGANGFAAGDSVTVSNIIVIDLTAMFGTGIADYIYSLEQTTAGSGVALFKSLFPNDYYPYNAGELVSVSGLSEHRMAGFNQWDEEWEVGGLGTGGNSETDKIRSKNYIPVVSGNTYFFYCESNALIFVNCYDSDKNHLSSFDGMRNVAVTIPEHCRYIRFRMQTSYGTTYKNDICINLSDPVKNGTYKPYKAHSYPLDSTLTLRGIPTLVDGKVKWDGDVYEYTGKVTRNTILRAYQSGDESLANAITDGTNTVVYSANASTEQATPYQHLQQCDPSGTEEYVSTGIVPVGHNSFYPENLKAKIDGLPWNFANLIAPTESAFVATRNYVTGDLFIVSNVLYKATSNIANGGTITPNTNCTATTLAEIISELA